MATGPIEFIEIAFPGNQFNGDIVPALRELVDSEIVRIRDLLFIKKDADGNIHSFELSTLDPQESLAFDDLDGDIGSLLSEEDIQIAADNLANNSSAALLVWENTWAARFANAVLAANGQVIVNERVPYAALEAALEAANA